MGPRIYPSQQDTNLTAKGSLILSIDNTIDYVDIYVNNNLVKRQYPIVNGLFEVGLNVNDVVRLESVQLLEVLINRKDYTTDNQNGNNGIIETPLSGITSGFSYTFTATTISSSYNFEYLLSVEIGGPKASLIFTYKTDITKNLGSATINANYFWVGGYAPGGPPPVPPTTLWNFVLGSYQFSGDTTTSYNLGTFPLSGMTNVPFLGSVTTELCYVTKDGLILQGIPDSFFKIYVNNVLQNSTTYNFTVPGFGIVNSCSNPILQTSVYTNFTCSNGDVVEFVFEDNFTIYDNTPTPTPTLTPTPTPTGGPTFTPTPTPTPTPVPSPINVTVEYRYIGTGGSGSSQKNVTSLNGTIFAGSTPYNVLFSSLNWFTTTDTTQTTSLTLPYTGVYDMRISRTICRTGSIQVIDNRTARLYINGTLALQNININNVGIPSCPSNITSSITLGSVTINNGDTLQFYFEDDMA